MFSESGGGENVMVNVDPCGLRSPWRSRPCSH
jgi:hypothetical protein